MANDATLFQVLAITEDLHDVHNLGKEASALHSSLMEDLSKVSFNFSSLSFCSKREYMLSTVHILTT